MTFRTSRIAVLVTACLVLIQSLIRWSTGAEQERVDQGSVSQASDSPSGPSPEMAALRDRLRACLAYYHQHREDVAYRSPWEIMHTLVAYCIDTEVVANGRQVNAIGWLCWNLPCRGQLLFSTRQEGIKPRVGLGVQGHDGLFLSLLALSKVPIDYGLKVGGEVFTVADLVEFEKRTCLPKTELSFKLLALVHYLDSDAAWQNQDGEDWDIPRLIKEELAQPVIGGTCGGTHRMLGLSYAVRKREKRGEPIDGQWLKAKEYVEDYHDYAFKLQNPDGSFSSEWLRRRADWGSVDRRLNTTGHILEWLVCSLPDEQLRDERVVKSVEYLIQLLMEHQTHNLEIGARGHALHALAVYDERVFASVPGQRSYLNENEPLGSDRMAAQ